MHISLSSLHSLWKSLFPIQLLLKCDEQSSFKILYLKVSVGRTMLLCKKKNKETSLLMGANAVFTGIEIVYDKK